MRTRTVFSVAILVDTATGWGRRLIRGIRNYAQQHGPWLIWVEGRGQSELHRLPSGWRGDGVIARVSTLSLARHLRAARIPVVNTSAIRLAGVNLPRVCNNVRRSAELAFEHLRDRGFHNFAYCGPDRLSWIEEHRRAFADAVKAHGAVCHVFRPHGRLRVNQSWREFMGQLGAWLKELPKPVGVFCWATQGGQDVLQACVLAGLDVPGEVAVLGGDDDELLCSTSWPPLSGIITPAEQIGAEAARLLDQLMRGERKPSDEIHIDPVGISTRQSTDTLAIHDHAVAAALRFIRTQSHRPIQVADVLREVPVSRRALERRFEHALGRTPSEEIRRVRLAMAVELLVNTELPIPDVAVRCGFSSPQYFARVFAEEHELTPLKFRHRNRGR